MAYTTFQEYKNKHNKTAYKVITPYVNDEGKKSSFVTKFDPHSPTMPMDKQEAKIAAMSLAAHINKVGPKVYFDLMPLCEAVETIYRPERKEQHKTSEPRSLTEKEMKMGFYNCGGIYKKGHKKEGQTYGWMIRTSLWKQPIKTINTTSCTNMVRELKQLCCKDSKITSVVDTLKQVIKICVASDKCTLQTNQIISFKRKKTKKDIAVQIPTKKDIDLMISKASPLYSIMFLFISLTGMRWQEMSAFTWNKISWNRDMLIIDHAIKDGYCTKGTKTAAGERDVPLVKILKDALLKWKEHPLSDKTNGDDSFIFGDGNGNYIPHHKTNVYYKRLKEECNLDWHGGIHSFRHYYASLLFDWHRKQAISLKDITYYIGHTDINFTMKKYAKCFNDEDKWFERVDKINACLDEF